MHQTAKTAAKTDVLQSKDTLAGIKLALCYFRAKANYEVTKANSKSLTC